MQVLAQVLTWLPVMQLVTSFYASNPGFCNMILDTAFSLIAAIFAFIILPAGDFIVGQEPPEAVRQRSGHHPLAFLDSSHFVLVLRLPRVHARSPARRPPAHHGEESCSPNDVGDATHTWACSHV